MLCYKYKQPVISDRHGAAEIECFERSELHQGWNKASLFMHGKTVQQNSVITKVGFNFVFVIISGNNTEIIQFQRRN